MMTFRHQYRQGDVFLERIAAKPLTAQRQERCILALGEVTGHAHQIQEEAFLWVDTDGTKYVEVYSAEAILTHEEHGPIVLPGPAIYRVTIQREYSPSEIKHVTD